MKLSSISAFFPAFNEEGNVETLCRAFLDVLPRVANEFEIIVVDDGSSDRTAELAEKLAEKHPEIRVVRHGRNQGYGAAVRSGFAASRCDHVFFTDGDNQFDVAQLPGFLEEAGPCDAVIGYRIDRKDPPIRKLNAWAWKQLVRALLGLNVRDIDCAFKIIRREFLDQIEFTTTGAMISTELLVKLSRLGAEVREVGVHHRPREVGTQTGANPRVVLRAFRELYEFRRSLEDG